MKLTQEQQKVVKALIEVAENMADQIYHVMKNHGLDKVNGCALSIMVEPEQLFTTEFVQFGDVARDSGIIRLAKGRRFNSEKFTPFGRNSAEFERLFADENLRSRMEANKQGEKPLPPDGLWIGGNDYDCHVDSGWN